MAIRAITAVCCDRISGPRKEKKYLEYSQVCLEYQLSTPLSIQADLGMGVVPWDDLQNTTLIRGKLRGNISLFVGRG